MDSNTLLRSQGWLGSGHALNRESGRGLSKPIRPQQKNNVLGIGMKEHDALTGQWWSAAFDEVLKNVNHSGIVPNGDSQEPHHRKPTNGASARRTRGSLGLYNCFVKGESLEGTFAPPPEESNEVAIEREQMSNEQSKVFEDGHGKRIQSKKRKRQTSQTLAEYGTQQPTLSSPKDLELPFARQGLPSTSEDNGQRRKDRKRARKAKRATDSADTLANRS